MHTYCSQLSLWYLFSLLVYLRIWYFPVMGVKRGGEWVRGGCMFLKKGGMKKRGLIHLSALCLICPRPDKDRYELLQTVAIKIFWTWWICKCFCCDCFWSQVSRNVSVNLKVPQKVPGMVCYWFASKDIPWSH